MNKLTLLFLLVPFMLLSQKQAFSDFLKTCPFDDPATEQILKDFKIYENDNLVESFAPCNDFFENPYDRKLSWLQALRVIYYLDDPIAWSDLTFYEWMIRQVDGVNLISGFQGGACCFSFDDGFVIKASADGPPQSYIDANEGTRFFQYYQEVLGIVQFIGHEARHRQGYGHSSCCERGNNACDERYNELDLYAYSIQYWVHKAFLTGDFYINFWESDLQGVRASTYANYHANNMRWISDVHCENQPEKIEIDFSGNMDHFWEGRNMTTSTNEIQKEKILIYPNPLRQGQKLNVNADYRIIDLQGRIVDEMTKGVYLIVGEFGSWKVVVE